MSRNKDFEDLVELMYLARWDRFGNQLEARARLDARLYELSRRHGVPVEEIEDFMHRPLMDYRKSRRRKGNVD